MTTISITIPDSLHATVRDIVEREGMSFEQFITLQWPRKHLRLRQKHILRCVRSAGTKRNF